MNEIRRADPLAWALKAALWVLVVIVVLPAGACAYVLFHTDLWQADVPAVVERVDSTHGH